MARSGSPPSVRRLRSSGRRSTGGLVRRSPTYSGPPFGRLTGAVGRRVRSGRWWFVRFDGRGCQSSRMLAATKPAETGNSPAWLRGLEVRHPPEHARNEVGRRRSGFDGAPRQLGYAIWAYILLLAQRTSPKIGYIGVQVTKISILLCERAVTGFAFFPPSGTVELVARRASRLRRVRSSGRSGRVRLTQSVVAPR